MNGTPDNRLAAPPLPNKVPRNYKLIVDPILVKGATAKVYRYDGIVQGDPNYPPVIPRDPRMARIRTRIEAIDLPVPRFAIISSLAIHF